jgi:M penetrans paralogue family 26
MDSMNQQYKHSNLPQSPLPNATAVLVLGICSIVVCSLCGIIGLILANQDMRLYNQNPDLYTESSLSNIKAGRICSIIGVVLLGLGLLVFLVALMAGGLSEFSSY